MRMATISLFMLLTTPVFAGNIYVTTNAPAGGDGSEDKPLDLITAVGEKSPAKAGDAIVLAAGVYEGPMSGDARDSGDITLPMRKSKESPEFDAFLVLPAP